MNRLRSHKFKLNSAPDVPETNNNNHNNSNGASGNGLLNNSLLNKISKRYSTLSNKITRRAQPGRRTTSPQKVISGSYDMTGSLSEDHRLEIGAPVLISSTTLDAERFDVSEERLKMIGGGVAATNNSKIRTIDLSLSTGVKPSLQLQQPQVGHSSSGSETEIFVDALSSTPLVVSADQEDKDVFGMAFETPQKLVTREEMDASQVSEKSTDSDLTPVNQMNNYYETSRQNRPKSILAQKPHSQSAQNLHRSEIKVYLQKAPSMDLNEHGDRLMSTDEADELENIALPKLPELYGQSKCDVAATTDNEQDQEMEMEDEEDHDADKENSSPSVVAAASLKSKSEPNTPFYVETKRNSFLTQQKLFQSAENIHQRRTKRRSVVFSSSTSINQRNAASTATGGSKNSLSSQQSLNFEDYDLKSVSCQSLNPQSLFVSIDELNEITRQINESEEFNQDIDLEYCTHRDQLKPSERRITLLKNKNSRLINFNHNKQKIKKGWSGVKHWIGEEGTKIREVVQRQPLVQRMGSSKHNLNNAECRNSPSLNGSTLLKHSSVSRGASQEKSIDESGRDSKMNSSMHLYDSQALSSDNIADSSNELNSSFEGQRSPPVKKAGQEVRRRAWLDEIC